MFAADGRIRLLALKAEESRTIAREWELKEDGFVDVTRPWLETAQLPGGESGITVKLMQTADGSQYLYADYAQEEGADFTSHLWKEENGEAKEITPKKWQTVNEEWGAYEVVAGIAALDNGTLMAATYTSIDRLNGSDGSVMESETVSIPYDTMVTDGKNL